MKKSAKNGFTQATGQEQPVHSKIAVVLAEPNSDQEIIKKINDYLGKNNYDVRQMDSTDENHLATANLLRTGAREKSVCYIAGSGLGNDPELVKKTRKLIREVSMAGYNTICPGSEGMMGVIVDEVKKLGKPVTSVFSLDVAQAYVEKLEAKFDRIVVAPNERVRQKLYHLLSGAQIALPGGTGTMTEGAVHYYQNAQIGIVYRNPKKFGPENFPSPIIYFSPATGAVQDAVKDIICKKMFSGDLKMQEKIRKTDINIGYWDMMDNVYQQMVKMGFVKPEYVDSFVKTLPTSAKVIKMLDNWSDPEVRNMMVMLNNIHHRETRQKLRLIMADSVPTMPSAL